MAADALDLKPLVWVGSGRKDLLAMPDEVQDVFGYALFLAQLGGKHDQAKPLRGHGSAAALEIVENCHDDTYRAAYTVRFGAAIYVLHCFQKKATKGIATPRRSSIGSRAGCAPRKPTQKVYNTARP